jgi:hypothetical protein
MVHRTSFLFACALTLTGCEGGAVDVDASAFDTGRDAHDEDAAVPDLDAAVPDLDAAEDDGGVSTDVGQDVPASDVGEDSWVPHPVECVLYPQSGCEPGLACYPAGHEGTQCVRPTAARAQPGEPCDFGNDCDMGGFCPWTLGDAGVRTCEEFCAVADSHCPTCVVVPEYRLVPGFGVCRR